MITGLIAALTEAVTAAINASGVGLETPAVRSYRPQFDLAELKTMRVSVVPKSVQITSLGRSSNQHDVSIDVAVQKKLAAADNTEIDPLMEVVQQLADALRLKRLATLPHAVWIKTEQNPIYAVEHLEQQRVFTSVLTLTYRVVQ